ncbi:MAG: 3-isopropylmalate dehydrogenase [Actinobacteria bacterium]|nr:MAG: 3-isopropylmalate dehydrogenase [Actinomycetota bacterium]
MDLKITVLAGDGIGPEIIKEAKKVLDAVSKKYGHSVIADDGLIGGIAIDETGNPFPKETIDKCQSSQAILLGAVGGPKWDTTDSNKPRPEQGLLGLRKELGLFANLRPVKVHNQLTESSTLKSAVVSDIDMIIVRELTGGIYFGKSARSDALTYDTCEYSSEEIIRIFRIAFDIAMKRRNNLISVDKANVLETSRLWREIGHLLKEEYADVAYQDMLVDNCAMQLIRNPGQFDIIVTENMFGDILSDEASMLTGSIGMLPSASLGEGNIGLYEPIHGSAPDIAGMDKANPMATILSVAMMLRYSFDLEKEVQAIENAVEQVLEQGYRTPDIMQEGKTEVSTSEMGDLVAKEIS